MELLKLLLKSIQNPNYINTETKSNPLIRFILIFKIFILKILLSIILIICIELVGGEQNKSFDSYLNLLSPFWAFSVIVVIGPIYEELIFRLPLKFNPLYLTLSLFLFSYFFLSSLIFSSNFLNIDKSIIYKIFFSFFISILFYFKIFRKKSLKIFWKNKFKLIYFISVLLFGVFHAWNFNITLSNFYILPILLSPHLLAGVILNFIRIRFGFLYCCVFHIFNNLFVYLLV